MAMEQTKLGARPREAASSNEARRLRREGHLPAIVYGGDRESRPILVEHREVLEILQSEHGENTILELSVEGQKGSEVVMIHDYQVDPLGTQLLHADFVRISLTEIGEFDVPIEVEGVPQGVKEGGVLDHILREIKVRCLPTDIPDEIRVDVEELEIGDSLHVSELVIPDNVEVLEEPERTVVSVVPPMKEEEIEPEPEELLGVAEPELIRPEREGELEEGEVLEEGERRPEREGEREPEEAEE